MIELNIPKNNPKKIKYEKNYVFLFYISVSINNHKSHMNFVFGSSYRKIIPHHMNTFITFHYDASTQRELNISIIRCDQ